jgi:hypothetical protein
MHLSPYDRGAASARLTHLTTAGELTCAGLCWLKKLGLERRLCSRIVAYADDP